MDVCVCVLIVLRIMIIFYFHFIQSRTLVVARKGKEEFAVYELSTC